MPPAASAPFFYAYPQKTSVALGDSINIHYLTNQAKFQIAVYRQGTSLSLVYTSAWFSAQSHAEATGPVPLPVDVTPATTDFRWPSTDNTQPTPRPVRISVPKKWVAGAYVLMFTAKDSTGTVTVGPSAGTYAAGSAFATSAQCLVVIRRARSSTPPAVMYKVPVMTYCAYNTTGGASMYSPAISGSVPDGQGGSHTGYRVTLLRSGCGTGGENEFWRQQQENDQFDCSSPYNCFAHWDAKMIAWLEANGYPAGTLDFCTDIDLHDNPRLLSGTRLLISAGHDEYWSSAMRDQVESFIARGGNVAFFGGNTSYWRVYCADDDGDGVTDAFVCDKTWNGAYGGSIDGNDLWWEPLHSSRPENLLTGVSTRYAGFAGGCTTGPGYTVQLTTEWIFANTGLSDGLIIGADEHLVNYEADGAASSGTPLAPTGVDSTPLTFRILGYAQLPPAAGGQWTLPDNETTQASKPCTHGATMGYFSRIGTVFTAATTEWPRVLNCGNVPVSQITQNVLRGLDSARIVQCAGDCNRDGVTDIVLRHPVSGAVSFWYCSGGAVSSSQFADYQHQQVPGWNLVAVGDLDGNSRSDLVWYNPTTGQIAFWYMDGAKVLSGAFVERSQDPAWTLVSTADFDLDGRRDLIFQNRATGQMAVWFLNNTAVSRGAFVTPTQDPAYSLICATDLNQDGKPELLFHNRTTGQVAVWFMTSGVAYVVGNILNRKTRPSWNVVAAGKFGIGGASTSQILLQHAKTMALQVWTLAKDGHAVTAQVNLTQMP